MRVIVSTQGLVPWNGGSAFSEAYLSAHLAKRCEVTVLCPQGTLDYAFARSCGLRDIRLYRNTEAFEAWKDSSHWLNRLFEEADVCHLNGHWRWEDYFFARLCARRQVPYVLQPRGRLLPDRKQWLRHLYHAALGNWVIRHATKLIALSHFEREQWRSLALSEDRAVVVPNGIAHPVPSPIANVSAPARLLERVGPYYLYLGRLAEGKNLELLVTTFRDYVAQGGDASLLLVGPAKDGFDQTMESLVGGLRLQERIQLMHPVYDADKWLYLQKARALIYPTLNEPFGRAPFEALAMGTFALVPDRSGNAESLAVFLPQCIFQGEGASPGSASLLAAMRNVENAATNGMREGLERARQWVGETLSWEVIADRVFALYQGMVGASPSHKRFEHDMIRR